MESQEAVAVPPSKGVPWLLSHWEKKSVHMAEITFPKRGNTGKCNSRAVAPLIEKIILGKKYWWTWKSLAVCAFLFPRRCWGLPHYLFILLYIGNVLWYSSLSFTVSIILPPHFNLFLSLPQSPHTAQKDRTVLVLPDHCAAAFLNYFSQQETALFPVLKAFFSPQLARNSPHSPAFQSTFNDTQGCGVPRLIQVHRGFFIIIPLFKLSAEKMKKREKILGFFPFPFSSMKKKKKSS